MDRRVAKEVLHIQGWLHRVTEIVSRGRGAYLSDELLQEAGDSLMMKLGEAANRLSRRNVPAPGGIDWSLAVANRNFIIHEYDRVNRAMAWRTLSVELVEWQAALQTMFDEANLTIGAVSPAADLVGRRRTLPGMDADELRNDLDEGIDPLL